MKLTLHLKLIINLVCLILSLTKANAQPKQKHWLQLNYMPSRWDEGLPIGNGWLGALIWQKEDRIRFSLDRVDLWDDRPMPVIDQLKFKWVVEQVKKQAYDTVQAIGDLPYDMSAAPTKIPGAAVEFQTGKFGKIIRSFVDISNALAVVEFSNGVLFNNYVHATRQTGYFSFENLPSDSIIPTLLIPAYNSTSQKAAENLVVDGQGLEKLGYAAGSISKTAHSIRYHQPTWNNHYYEVLIKWVKAGNGKILGAWTISADATAKLPDLDIRLEEPTEWPSHIQWWKEFWSRSSLSIPDTLLEKQYYLEMYKFGSVARENTPPISLQAIWTADNNNLPPWKGDYHHDLNTQLSYWPGYTSNHTDLTASYTNWLWKVKKENQRWTKQYFEVGGLNVPGVTTLSGKEMGGWIQYAMSPTTVAWVAHHFYLQWAYTQDRRFLIEKCYPYMAEAEKYFSALAIKNEQGFLQLPLSASPEIHDNSLAAWFLTPTNYDLALLHDFYIRFAEVKEAVERKTTSSISSRGNLFAPLNHNKTGLTVAAGENLTASHRHHSNLMAIYPLVLLKKELPAEKEIILNSLKNMESLGTRAWVGYSFSWAACLYAKAGMGDTAVSYLKKFAQNFCSVNSFHLNGDQKGGEYSGFTYRPFTLEGNFAFAQEFMNYYSNLKMDTSKYFLPCLQRGKMFF